MTQLANKTGRAYVLGEIKVQDVLHGLEDEDKGRGWQLSIAVYPEKKNLNKAAELISDLILYTGLKFSCVVENDQNQLLDLDGTQFGYADQEMRGKEFRIHLRFDSAAKRFEASPEYFKHLMLLIWKRLQLANIDIGYMSPYPGDREITIKNTHLITPFSYTCAKFPGARHGGLHENVFNAREFEDPLKGVEFTLADLAAYQIDFSAIKKMQVKRVKYLRSHYRHALERITGELTAIIEKEEISFISRVKSLRVKFNQLIREKNRKKIKILQENISTILKDIESFAPGNAEHNLNEDSSIVMFREVWRNYLAGQLALKQANVAIVIDQMEGFVSNEINELKIDYTDPARKVADLLKPSQLNSDKIVAAIHKNPAAMQLYYRRLVHLHYEKAALEKEETKLNARKTEVLAVPRAAKKSISLMSVTKRLFLQEEKTANAQINLILTKIKKLNKKTGIVGGEQVLIGGKTYTVPAGAGVMCRIIAAGRHNYYPASKILNDVINVARFAAQQHAHGCFNRRQPVTQAFYTYVSAINPVKHVPDRAVNLITKGQIEALIRAYHEQTRSIFCCGLFHKQHKTKGIEELENFLRSSAVNGLSNDKYLTGSALYNLIDLLNNRENRVHTARRNYESAPDKKTNRVYTAIINILSDGIKTACADGMAYHPLCIAVQHAVKKRVTRSAFYELVKSAHHADAACAYQLGKGMMIGSINLGDYTKNLKPNIDKGLKWLKIAAKAGHTHAAYFLAGYYACAKADDPKTFAQLPEAKEFDEERATKYLNMAARLGLNLALECKKKEYFGRLKMKAPKTDSLLDIPTFHR